MRCVLRSSCVARMSVAFLLVFLFREKTSYEITVSLDYRGVVFRSYCNKSWAGKSGGPLLQQKLGGKKWGPAIGSEERSVGKGCRSRWETSH